MKKEARFSNQNYSIATTKISVQARGSEYKGKWEGGKGADENDGMRNEEKVGKWGGETGQMKKDGLRR